MLKHFFLFILYAIKIKKFYLAHNTLIYLRNQYSILLKNKIENYFFTGVATAPIGRLAAGGGISKIESVLTI